MTVKFNNRKFEININCRFNNFSAHFKTYLIFLNRCKDLAYVIKDLRKKDRLPRELRIFNRLVSNKLMYIENYISLKYVHLY